MQGKCVTTADELMLLVQERRSVVYGSARVRVPAAVFINYTFAHVSNMLRCGRVFVYEKEEKKPDGRLCKTKS